MKDADEILKEIQALEEELQGAFEEYSNAMKKAFGTTQKLASLESRIDAAGKEVGILRGRKTTTEKTLDKEIIHENKLASEEDSAKKTFLQAAEKQPVQGNVKELYSAWQKLTGELATAKTAVSVSKETLHDIQTPLTRLEEAVSDYEGEMKIVSAENLEAMNEIDSTIKTVGKLWTRQLKLCEQLADASGDGENEKPSKSDQKIIDLIAAEGDEKLKDFLTIRTRKIDYDAWAKEALSDFAVKYEKLVPAADFRKLLLDSGIASKIAKVTQKMNRRRIKDIRRELLTRAFPYLLSEQIIEERKRKIFVNVEAAADAVGLADMITLNLSSKDDGSVRSNFADIMTDIAVRNMNLDAPKGGVEYAIIKAKLIAAT